MKTLQIFGGVFIPIATNAKIKVGRGVFVPTDGHSHDGDFCVALRQFLLKWFPEDERAISGGFCQDNEDQHTKLSVLRIDAPTAAGYKEIVLNGQSIPTFGMRGPVTLEIHDGHVTLKSEFSSSHI